jgi:2,3-bisphosphoglycerate-independent phosphoglycerate mutase
MLSTTLLCILDGFGIGNNQASNNAIALANMPNYRRILNNYPHSQLLTSGLSVGLPEGQIGNSEVGHITIGAGRVIYQDLPKINLSIADGSLAKHNKLEQFLQHLKQHNLPCHLMGLCSDGGVHSHVSHLKYLAEIVKSHNIELFLHLFTDGRDVAQKSILQYLSHFSSYNIATISGRYYAMDRDNKLDRIKLTSDAIIAGLGPKFANTQDAINHYYQQNITDEFILPSTIGNYNGITNKAGLIFANFRADRARQISQALQDSQKFSTAIALTQYSEQLNNFYQILFPPQKVVNSLPELLSKHNLTQLRIAETEKYAHVSFFFSCGQEQKFAGEDRILVPSPAVATYDLQPEMSANIVGEKLLQAIASKKYNFIVVNYANADMVGHSGLLQPAIKACETLDKQLGLLESAILQAGGNMLITADHGNIECMSDTKNQPHTAHTTNPVPFILINQNAHQYLLKNGSLQDIAPSILQLFNIDKPQEMTGTSLILQKNENTNKK